MTPLPVQSAAGAPGPAAPIEAVALNEALLIAGLRQHELVAAAELLNAQLAGEINERKVAQAALQAANHQLADQAGQLETLVAERTGKLRETVADLEAFSYSVAHDMRAPLRSMQGFARLLQQDHAGQLDATGHDYLQRIASSAARMDLLIQDVLNYTRVMRSEALLVTVDLDRLMRDLIALYPHWRPPLAGIRIDGPLPAVLGHEGFLTQCLSNIVGNAIKFVAPGVRPSVRIWAEERTTESTRTPWPAESRPRTEADDDGTVVRVWFEDNGIGIAPDDRARVFRLLERINPADQFEGTGIGLAIVSKAMQRLGGRVDFESTPGEGSRFWIELRKAPAPTADAPLPT